MNGVILIDKPTGWTSHDVVNRMRRILGQRSVGHLGTLDPLASGALPLVVGNFTRLAQFYTASEKTYEGVIRFGFATTTYDADGDPVTLPAHPGIASLGSPHFTLNQLQPLAAQFVGVIEQIPPPFSAKKIHGVPAYKLARRHQEVDLKPVQVEIKEFTITSVENDRARFHARVASGTYMRSVAHDLGQRLGCGAHLESLRRTSVAEFEISQAHTLDEIEEVNHASSPGNPSASAPFPQEKGNMGDGPTVQPLPRSMAVGGLFVHARQLLPQFPCVTADESTVARIGNGRPVNLPELSRARQVKVFANQTDLIAIATRVAGTLFHPKIVFAVDRGSAS
jgi:tRNA pseudouridine55 synthase